MSDVSLSMVESIVPIVHLTDLGSLEWQTFSYPGILRIAIPEVQ